MEMKTEILIVYALRMIGNIEEKILAVMYATRLLVFHKSYSCFLVFRLGAKYRNIGRRNEGKERPTTTISAILKNVHPFVRWFCSTKAEFTFC